MRLDLTNVPDTQYIDEECVVTLKVVKVDESETTPNGNTICKVHFQDKDGRLFIDDIVISEKSLWKIKGLTKAAKLNNICDTLDLIGRYVIAHLYLKDEPTKTGGTFKKTTCKKYEPSPLTNTQIPQPITLEEEADLAF